MIELGPEGSCIVSFTDVLDEPFFNFGPVKQLVGSTSDESDMSNQPRPFHKRPID